MYVQLAVSTTSPCCFLAGDARSARVGSPGVGRVVRDRRRGGGQGDQHPPLPAGDRPKVGGHRLWRLQEPVRGAAASSTDYERGVGGGSLHGCGREQVPPLIDDYERGDLKLDHYITHRFEGVEGTLEAVHALHSGECLRAVVTY